MNVRRIIGNHRQLYGPVMWADTRRQIRSVRVLTSDMGLEYVITKTVAGRQCRMHVSMHHLELMRSSSGWRNALAWRIRGARFRMREEIREFIARQFGTRLETSVERYERQLNAHLALLHGYAAHPISGEINRPRMI